MFCCANIFIMICRPCSKFHHALSMLGPPSLLLAGTFYNFRPTNGGRFNVPKRRKKSSQVMCIIRKDLLTSLPCISIKSDFRQSLSFQEHFLGVMKNQEFLLLPACEVEKLLVSDDMNVPDEETVVSALLSWVRYDPANRQSQLPALLQHVRLPLLKPQVSLPVCQSC